MEIKNVKMLLFGAVAFTLANIWWIYLYTLLGVRFESVFDPMAFLSFVSNTPMILLAVLIGALIAFSIFIVRFFSNYLTFYERAAMVIAGTMIPIIAMASLFANVVMFFGIMLFYMAGCILFINTGKEDGILSRMKFGMDDSRKIISIMAVGALLMSLLFVYNNFDESKAKFKEALVNVQSSINVAELLTKDDVKQMLISQELSVDELRELTISQFVSTLGKTREELLSDPSMVALIDQTAEDAYDVQVSSRDSNVDLYFSKLQNVTSSSVAPLMEKLFDRPPLKYLFDFLPILVSVMVASVISFFGMVLVSPVGAVLGAFVPARQQEPAKK